MLAANAVKEYIKYEIGQKAASAVRDANDRYDNADKAADAAYNKLTLIVDKIVEDANKKVKAAVERVGLSSNMIDGIIHHHLLKYQINEFREDVPCNHMTAIGKARHDAYIEKERIRQRVNREVGRIILRFESGAKYDEIASMIAAIKF